MAYSKQTWTDDVSAVTGARMTHIEQGIYDNSLATDKINPSGTATTTAEIEEGQITDVIGFKSLKLKGQTSQYTTTGYNLLPPGESGTYTSSQMTHKSDGKGTYTFNGTANAVSSHYWEIEPYTIQSGDYLYLGNYVAQSGVSFSLYENSSTEIASLGSSTTTNRIISLNDYAGKTITLVRTYSLAQTLSNYEIKPMICNTSTMTTFEEYTGGKASPNPDFPQDVNNVSGDNVVGISNKNLIEDETFVQGTFNESSGTKRVSCRNVKLKANTTYTLSTNLNYSTYNVAIVTSTNQFPIQASETPKYDSGWKTANFSFTTGNDDVYANIAVKKVGELVIAPSDVSTYHFQIEQNNSATSYIAHQGNNFEINLGTNVVYSPRIWQNTSTVTTQANRLFSTPQKLVKAGTYKLATTLDFTTYKYALEVGTTPYPFASNLHDSGWKTTNNFSHTIPKGFVGIIVTRLDNANITADEMKGVKFELRDTTLDDYDIELCKIGTYQDYIYKKDGKWWKHKAVQKIKLNGSESWVLDGALTNTNRFRLGITSYNIQNIALTYNGFSNQLPILNAYSDDSEHLYTYKPSSVMHLYVFYTKTRCADLAGLQTYLSANNLIIYGILNTPIEEEITYAPLLRQLDELYNSGLYDVTNISQDNSSEAFILDLEACKNNINGIVEYIRR